MSAHKPFAVRGLVGLELISKPSFTPQMTQNPTEAQRLSDDRTLCLCGRSVLSVVLSEVLKQVLATLDTCIYHQAYLNRQFGVALLRTPHPE